MMTTVVRPAAANIRDVEQLAKRAIDAGDGTTIDALAASEELDRLPVEVLNELLIMVEHHQHQHVARVLQRVGDETTVTYVQRAIKMGFEHLAYSGCDDADIAKWYSWVLYAIGTIETVTVLEELSMSDNVDVAAVMRYRLARMTA